jgi:hypothetical protein
MTEAEVKNMADELPEIFTWAYDAYDATGGLVAVTPDTQVAADWVNLGHRVEVRCTGRKK